MDSSHQRIVSYDPAWVEKYNQEAEKLKPIFGDSFIDIEHIGSTSIPNLSSKPIIDIAVLIKDYTEADKFIKPLAEIGYIFDKELHTKTQYPERHFFRKGNPTKFHLSVAYANKAKFWFRQLLFRDYLRDHPEEREKYEALKRKLIEKDPSGIATYISGKSDFVQQILKKAGFK